MFTKKTIPSVHLLFFSAISLLVLQSAYANKPPLTAFQKNNASIPAVSNLIRSKTEQEINYQLIISHFEHYDQAFNAAVDLKKNNILSKVDIQGKQLEGDFHYWIVVANRLNKNTAEQLKYELNQLGYQHIDLIALESEFKAELKAEKSNSLQLIDDTIADTLNDSRNNYKPLLVAANEKVAILSDDEDIILAEGDEIILLDDEETTQTESTSAVDSLELQSDELETGADFLLEQQYFTRSESPVDQLQYLHLDAYADWQINALWNARLGARADGNYQHGDHKDNDTDFDYTDSYLRYRDDNYRFTLGAQTIHWGRMDTFSPNDRLAVLDLSRGVLEQWGENYRSTAAVRSELFWHYSKLDFVIIPRFREAELSEKNQVWYPVDTRQGRILGFGKDELLSSVVKNSRIDDNNFSKKAGYGLRYSSMVNSVDYAFNIQNIQLSTPYYRSDLKSGLIVDNAQLTLYEEHPENWILGADMAFEWQDMSWRFEAAWFSDLPATTPLWDYKKYNGLEWAAGVEFYPGDSDTQVNMQLSGRNIFNNEKIVDRDNSITLSGSVESELDNGKWKLSTRYSLGIDMKDIYLAPEVSYLGWEPYELYMGYHYLDGADQSVGGFFTNNKLLNLGLRIKH